MKKIQDRRIKEHNLEIIFSKNFPKEDDIGERDFYLIWDSSIKEYVCEMLVNINEDSIYIGDIDCSNWTTNKDYYNLGYGKKIISHLKKEFKIISGQSIPQSIGFWEKQGAEIEEDLKFTIKGNK